MPSQPWWSQLVEQQTIRPQESLIHRSKFHKFAFVVENAVFACSQYIANRPIDVFFDKYHIMLKDD